MNYFKTILIVFVVVLIGQEQMSSMEQYGTDQATVTVKKSICDLRTEVEKFVTGENNLPQLRQAARQLLKIRADQIIGDQAKKRTFEKEYSGQDKSEYKPLLHYATSMCTPECHLETREHYKNILAYYLQTMANLPDRLQGNYRIKKTPLHIAASHNDWELVVLLTIVDKRFNETVAIVDQDNQTPLGLTSKTSDLFIHQFIQRYAKQTAT